MNAIFFLLTLGILTACSPPSSEPTTIVNAGQTIKERFSVPPGYTRVNTSDQWQAFLQDFKTLPPGAKVLDYTGKPIAEQKQHVAVLDIDVGSRDLQQCADAVIRLRSEFLWQNGLQDQVTFQFTSGHSYAWKDYSKGIRPNIDGNRVTFASKSTPASSYQDFRKYLDIIFMYAGTISIHREMKKVDRKSEYQIGDVLVHPGSPGHAVIIVDKAKNAKGKSIYLLAQGYTPAQSIHIVKSGHGGIDPWFDIPQSGPFFHKRFYLSNLGVRRF